MATIHLQKIVTGWLDGFKSTKVQWNNPPEGTVLSFFANASPEFTTTPDHFSGTASVRIGTVMWTSVVDELHLGKSHHYVTIEVINAESSKMMFDLFMSWVT